MTSSEIRQMADGALNERLRELYQEMFNLRFQRAVAQLENSARMRVVRKDIARVKTILGERVRKVQGG
ncbi:MAG: 50S ribosomal protein L29 [Magnetococcales bacterium]|nr:50S ribosomal protein L29 [Magnetococcales bacterium]